MKILHVITSLRTGGAEKLLVDLLPAFKSMGHTVELLLFDGTVTPFYTQLNESSITIHHLGMGNNVYNPINIFKLKRYINEFDIIHTHNTACQYYLAIAKVIFKSKCKLFTTEHSSNNRRRSIKLFKYIDRVIYRLYNKIISVSEKTSQNLSEYLGETCPITTINNGINTLKYFSEINPIAANDKILITMIAAFRHEKDQDTLVQAISTLPNNYNLWLIGQGPRQQEIKTLASNLGVSKRVNFSDFIADIPQALKDSDIIVLSSHWEGLSLSSIEGMASGRPFIASNVDGLREIVGGAGILFPHKDYVTLAAEIEKLSTDPEYYTSVAKLCHARAMQYDVSIMANKYNSLYNE
ncbi:MAG: glycosyltransferase [Muribaculaceae bacterium]|nr:glycosyltransferase [Muribaculaceae bacterium]